MTTKMNMRETAWRAFAHEINSSTFTVKSEEEKAPSYQVSPLGAFINRVLIAGVLTEKENVGTEDEPMWRGRIQDIASGTIFINVGRFQPEASAEMADIEAPDLVAVVGKIRSYTGDDGRVFVSVRPERIIRIDETTQKEWLMDTAKSTWERMLAMKKAIGTENADVQMLSTAGFTQHEAEGMMIAIQQYGGTDSAPLLSAIQAALRYILPDDNIDMGLPEDPIDGGPDEIEFESEGDSSADMEDTVLKLLDKLDTEGKGAPRDELEAEAEAEGISSMELEEVSNSLMDKGLVYEPNLRYLRRI